MLSLEFSFEPLSDAPIAINPERFAQIARFVLEQQTADGEWTVAVALVNDDHLRQLHLDFMGIDEPTDVMTFPLSGKGSEQGGDIAISVDHAVLHGSDWGNSPVEEIEFLMIHGLLHLLGWRDDDDIQRAAMLQRQDEIVREYQAAQEAG